MKILKSNPPSHDGLREVFADIIHGRIVKRGKHDLRRDLRDVSLDFVDALRSNGYVPLLVQDIAVKPGERVPLSTLIKAPRTSDGYSGRSSHR